MGGMFNVGVGILFRDSKIMGFVIKAKCRKEKKRNLDYIKNKKSKRKPGGKIAFLL
jgi:hypothetical protein